MDQHCHLKADCNPFGTSAHTEGKGVNCAEGQGVNCEVKTYKKENHIEHTTCIISNLFLLGKDVGKLRPKQLIFMANLAIMN